MAPWTVSMGSARVPGFESAPSLATKMELPISLSTPSQLVSTPSGSSTAPEYAHSQPFAGFSSMSKKLGSHASTHTGTAAPPSQTPWPLAKGRKVQLLPHLPQFVSAVYFPSTWKPSSTVPLQSLSTPSHTSTGSWQPDHPCAVHFWLP